MDFRADQVNQHQQIVAQEEKKVQDIKNLIGQNDQQIRNTFVEQQLLIGQEQLDPVHAQGFIRYMKRLKDEQVYAQQVLKQQEVILEKARQELKVVLIKKKSLEKLKEKESIKFNKVLEKADEVFLSEISMFKAYQATAKQKAAR